MKMAFILFMLSILILPFIVDGCSNRQHLMSYKEWGEGNFIKVSDGAYIYCEKGKFAYGRRNISGELTYELDIDSFIRAKIIDSNNIKEQK